MIGQPHAPVALPRARATGAYCKGGCKLEMSCNGSRKGRPTSFGINCVTCGFKQFEVQRPWRTHVYHTSITRLSLVYHSSITRLSQVYHSTHNSGQCVLPVFPVRSLSHVKWSKRINRPEKQICHFNVTFCSPLQTANRRSR